MLDEENFKLKEKITKLEDAELLKMISNHKDYRQSSLNLAMEELGRRQITFNAPPPKPEILVRRKTFREKLLLITGAVISLSIGVFLLYIAINDKDGNNQEAVLRIVLWVAVTFVIFFIALTTNKSNDD